jgi:hypothetical protein
MPGRGNSGGFPSSSGSLYLECLLEVVGIEKQKSGFRTGGRIHRSAGERIGNRVVWQP